MNIKVRVPLSFQRFTGNKAEFECHGNTVEELLANITNQYHGIQEMLYDEESRIRPSLSLFVNGKIIGNTKKEKISLKEGDDILIMQLIAGG
jgi:sulfur carrier protein ThiS